MNKYSDLQKYIPVKEQEATIFALNLLIPKDKLINFINTGNKTISDCADYFKVSNNRIRQAIKLYDIKCGGNK